MDTSELLIPSPSRFAAMAQRFWFWPVVAILLFAPWIKVEVGQGNVASDLAAIDSLVARHTFFINDSPFVTTLDKFKRGDLYFSQKSPIFHLVAAFPIWGMSAFGYSLAEHPAFGLRLLTLLFVILPMGWLLRLIHSHPWMAGLDHSSRFVLTLAFAAGSLLTPFCITFNHYVPASAFLMAAVLVLVASSPQNACLTFRRGLTIGLFTSASIACDITPAFIFGVGVAVWFVLQLLWRRNSLPILFGMAAGALPIALAYAALNQHIVGSPLPPNMHESEMLYYGGSFWAEQQAKIARGEPDFYEASYARRIIHATFGYKGIYWMMPLLMLATISALNSIFRKAPPIPLLSLIFFPVITILVVMRWTLDHGGGQYVIRHVFPAIAPIYCCIGLLGSRWKSSLWRVPLVACSLWGILISCIGFIQPWSHNTLSAVPPVENLARLCLAHPRNLPTGWIGHAIELTSVAPANAWLDLGLEYMNSGKLEESEGAFRHAIQLDKKYAIAYYHLGITLDMQNRPREAIVVYESLIALEPENTGAWNNLGIFCLRAGDALQARRAFDQSLLLVPDNATALWGQLVLEKADGQARPDSSLLLRALKLHPSDPRIQSVARERGLSSND